MHDIKIHDVSFSYAGSDKLVLKDINVDVEGGEFVCILGQSGCGKSTLLRLIAGLEDCTTGEILVDGEKIHGASLNRGVVFQDYGLFPWKTAGANITLALKKKFPDWDKNHLKERTIELLKAVGLDESVYRKYPKELSGGMKQRCAIASAFGIDPPILAVVIAIVGGTILGMSKKIRKVVHPVVYSISVIPSILMSPFALLMAPSFRIASLFLVVYNTIWATFFATINGIMTIDKVYLDKAKTLELNPVEKMFQVILPAAMPSIMSGFITSLRGSFVVLVYAEMYGAKFGMGFYVKKFAEYGLYSEAWSGFIFMVVVLVIVMQIFEKMKNRILRWTIN